MTALMAEVLELARHETVLEVGAGCGYAAAVLGALAARVITVEIIPGLARSWQRDNLRRTGRDGNVTVVAGDGSVGSSRRMRHTMRSRWRRARPMFRRAAGATATIRAAW